MGKRRIQSSEDEFPLLEDLGLYASATTGDGNCLFRALSDQMYGDETHHADLRRAAVKYISDHHDHFAGFVSGFGEPFEQYVKRMSKDGVYGGHLEIAAFAEAYAMEVAIYQAEYMYMVHPNTSQAGTKGRVHVAYHTWEHYSSVRNKAGPHSGLPHVEPHLQPGAGRRVVEDKHDDVPRWKVDIVLRSVPDASENRVCELLRKKDHGDVIEQLLMEDLEGGPNSELEPEKEREQDQNKFQKEASPDPTVESVTQVEDGPPTPPRDQDPKSSTSGTRKKKTAREKRQEKRQAVMEKRNAKKGIGKERMPPTPREDEKETRTDVKIIHI